MSAVMMPSCSAPISNARRDNCFVEFNIFFEALFIQRPDPPVSANYKHLEPSA